MLNFIKEVLEKLLAIFINKKRYIAQEVILKVEIPKRVEDSKVEKLYPGIKDQVYAFLNEANLLNAYIFCGLRTMEEQADLYAKGRTTSGKIVTNAKPGLSFHNYGLAIDVVFKEEHGWTWSSDKWNQLGELGEKHGFEWGGRWSNFPDRPHFQIVFEQSIKDLLKIYAKNNEIQSVWSYLDDIRESTKQNI